MYHVLSGLTISKNFGLFWFLFNGVMSQIVILKTLTDEWFILSSPYPQG